jgi:UDP-N-acetyl-D-glucosamine dehydrogenase
MIERREVVCVQGLGFVGSAMAVAVAMSTNLEGAHRYEVVGVDLPSPDGQSRVDAINRGEFPFPAEDENLSSAIRHVHGNGNLRATTDPRVFKDAKVIIVDVHLDVSGDISNPVPEFENFQKAITTIGQYSVPGSLVVVETTVPPGTCTNLVGPVLEKEYLKRGLDPQSFHLAHSYERVMPGPDYLSSITDYWRVFSGYTEEAANLCENFLSTVINVKDFPLTRLASTTASEAAKVLENTYRAVNIALIDEWTKYADQIGIDLFEIIDAIGLRPTHSNIRSPGLGVGGYCLTKDPLFAPASAKYFLKEDLEFPFAKLAIQTNQRMPYHSVQRLTQMIKNLPGGPKILVCGVSYRPDVGDTRYSPSETLVRALVESGADVLCHDPYVEYWDEMNTRVERVMPAAGEFDAVVFAVAHRQYREFDILSWASPGSTILDSNRVFSQAKIQEMREKGIHIQCIGRGDGG